MTTTAIGQARVNTHTANLLAVLKQTTADWLQDNAMRLAAALALYTILSMAPLVVITFKIVGLFLHDRANAQLTQQLTSLMGAETSTFLLSTFQTQGQAHKGIFAVVISTVVLLFSATGVFTELQDSMNTIWGVKPKPNQGIVGLIRNRLLSLAMVFGVGFLLLVSMFISTTLTGLAQYVIGNSSWFAIVVDVSASFLIVTLLFAAIFKFLPDVHLPWRFVWTGAVLTALLFTVGKYGLAMYFKYATPQSAYGAAGSLAAVLIWIYYSAFILFYGAEFTKVWSLKHGHHVIPDGSSVKVTEEDRAQRGIPSEERMHRALTGKPLEKLPAPLIIRVRDQSSRRPIRPINGLFAAGGIAVGAVAALAVRRYLPGEINASDNERLKRVEQGIVETFSHRGVLKDLAAARIDRLEREVAKKLKH